MEKVCPKKKLYGKRQFCPKVYFKYIFKTQYTPTQEWVATIINIKTKWILQGHLCLAHISIAYQHDTTRHDIYCIQI